MNADTSLTSFQVFVLSYLTMEDMIRRREKTAFGRAAADLPLKYRHVTTINELTTIVHPDLIPGNMFNAENMMNEIEKQVDELITDELLLYETQPSHPNFKGKQYESFYITPKGKIYVRRHFSGLEELVADPSKYEVAVERVQTSTAVKTYLRRLRNKLVEKTQDQIIETIISSAREYAPAAIAMILQLMGMGR